VKKVIVYCKLDPSSFMIVSRVAASCLPCCSSRASSFSILSTKSNAVMNLRNPSQTAHTQIANKISSPGEGLELSLDVGAVGGPALHSTVIRSVWLILVRTSPGPCIKYTDVTTTVATARDRSMPTRAAHSTILGRSDGRGMMIEGEDV
jgi:hypothetical protein